MRELWPHRFIPPTLLQFSSVCVSLVECHLLLTPRLYTSVYITFFTSLRNMNYLAKSTEIAEEKITFLNMFFFSFFPPRREVISQCFPTSAGGWEKCPGAFWSLYLKWRCGEGWWCATALGDFHPSRWSLKKKNHIYNSVELNSKGWTVDVFCSFTLLSGAW